MLGLEQQEAGANQCGVFLDTSAFATNQSTKTNLVASVATSSAGLLVSTSAVPVNTVLLLLLLLPPLRVSSAKARAVLVALNGRLQAALA